MKTFWPFIAALSCWNSGFSRKPIQCSGIHSSYYGPSATTSYNLGLCCLGLGRSREALELMREACSLDPSFEPARHSRFKLEDQVRTGELELS